MKRRTDSGPAIRHTIGMPAALGPARLGPAIETPSHERAGGLGLLILFLLVAAAWFPLAPYWQSDDFIALHYARDLDRAVSDFAGNQYGLDGLVWFYRPLITLSWWFDQAVGGGPNAWVTHGSNVAAHAVSACLVTVIAARFVGARSAWLAGLLWGLAPTHAGSVLWAAGRVDSHTTVWILLAVALWLHARATRRRAALFASLAATALALCSKESAIVVPGIVALLGFCAAPAGVGFRRRLVDALACWPFAVTVALYLGWRFWLFDRLVGGYTAGNTDVIGQAPALARATLDVLNPMRVLPGDARELPGAVLEAGIAPAALAVVLALCHRRFALLAACLLAYVGLAVPIAPFWGQTASVENLRLWYFPMTALAVLLARGGVPVVVLAIVAWLAPALEARRSYDAVFDDARQRHELLLDTARELAPEPAFVAGLPRGNGPAVAFHLGVDRLLRPPFVPPELARSTFALRPLDPRPDAIALPYGDDVGLPFELPTLTVADPAILARLPRARVGALRAERDGFEFVPTRDLKAMHDGEVDYRIVVAGVRRPHYRVTLFAAGGYLSTLVPDRSEPDATNGSIAVIDVLMARYVTTPGQDEAHVAFALRIPTTLDLEPSFPVLVEAGRMEGPGGTHFVATHANREPLWLTFERSYAEFLDRR